MKYGNELHLFASYMISLLIFLILTYYIYLFF